ncbi:MAG: hypothetical protein ACP5OO_06580 [Chloroflexia bacterium]
MRGRNVTWIVTGILILALAMPALAWAQSPGLPPEDPWPPASQAQSPPAVNTTAIPVAFTAKDQGSGVAEVHLWASCGSAWWHDTGLVSYETSGTFDYQAECGEGLYRFATVALDMAGNWEPEPVGDGDSRTLLDMTAPSSSAFSPFFVRGTVIPVNFTFSDNLSGVAEIHLWVAHATVAGWQDSGLVYRPGPDETGFVFPYRAAYGSGLYFFATVAVDPAGNWEKLPEGQGDTQTYLDYTSPDVPRRPPAVDPFPPTSSAQSPGLINTAPIAVSYVAQDQGLGVSQVYLWAHCGSLGWHDTGLSSQSAVGVFHYSPECGEGLYHFATVAVDRAGNWEALPTGEGDSRTILDTTPPQSQASSPYAAFGLPIPVSFDYTDEGSGVAEVHLWVRVPNSSAGWQDSGLVFRPNTPALPVFLYNAGDGNGTYYFATVAVDQAGNWEDLPSGDGDTHTYLDIPGPIQPPSPDRLRPMR